MKFRSLMMIFATAALLLTAGCLPPPVDESVTAGQLLGTWRIYRIVDEEPKAVGDEEAPRLELLKDGILKFHYRDKDKKIVSQSGKWQLVKGVIKINPGSEKSYDLYVLSADTLQRKVPPSTDYPAGIDLYLVK